MDKINKMTFDLENGEGLEDLTKLIKFLCTNSVNEKYVFNDIRVSYDAGFGVVEWTQVLKSGEDDCNWVFKDYDKILVKQVDFPDGHYEFARDAEEEKTLWDEWKVAHPEWIEEDTVLGKRWVNKMEKYEDYPDDMANFLEKDSNPLGHIEEPDYEAEWEKTKKQITEEQYDKSIKEMERIADVNPTPESVKTMWDSSVKYIEENCAPENTEVTIGEIRPLKVVEDTGEEYVLENGMRVRHWEPTEDGMNPAMESIFDKEEMQKLQDCKGN